MESRMDSLYVIHNKSYHYPLLVKLFGYNPLLGMPVEAVAIYCPADKDENRILEDCSTVCRGNNGVALKYAGRTTVLY